MVVSFAPNSLMTTINTFLSEAAVPTTQSDQNCKLSAAAASDGDVIASSMIPLTAGAYDVTNKSVLSIRTRN